MKTTTGNISPKSKAIPESATANSSPNITVTLLPQDYKNEMFEQNLGYFKVAQPALFNAIIKHKCEEYRLCSNPDGSPNILQIQNKKIVYPVSSVNDFLPIISKQINSLPCNIRVLSTFLRGGEEGWRNNNPIQVKTMDRLYSAGIFQKMNLSPDRLSILDDHTTDYLPLVRVYGIGLGYHLTELVKQKNVSYITIYEPHLDLFYTSLYIIPWQLIFKYFSGKGKGINLSIAITPDEAIEQSIAFIQQRLVPLTSFFYRLNHFPDSPAIKEVIKKEPQTDELQRNQADAGWYEDQRAGFYYSARNIKKGNKFFTGHKTKIYFRAFIVGSGPSLNETIDYIKSHQDDAIIISCGSAITPLLKAGIIPDYEVVQERVWHFEKHEERHDLDLIKQITLLKLNVVSPQIDKHYKETLIFQKFKDPGSTLLGNNYAVTMAVNPTVTNAGISMAAELGVNEVFLFGVDYGAPKNSSKMHAANTVYDDESIDDNAANKTCFELQGNLGAVIQTTSVLSYSHKTTEERIVLHPEIQWFNVGEGALIANTIPLAYENLPVKFSQKINKQNLRQEILNCFNNNYSPVDVLNQLNTHYMQQVDDYFQALLGFTDSCPRTREEIIYVLSLLYNAMNFGSEQTHFLPTSLLSYGFKQFINNIYIQTSLEPDDDSAAHFYENSKSIFINYIADIRENFTELLEHVNGDQEREICTYTPFFN